MTEALPSKKTGSFGHGFSAYVLAPNGFAGSGLVWVLALLARAIYVWQIRETPLFNLLTGDASAYDVWAQQIARGDWLGKEVFFQSPSYAYFLGVLYAIGGHNLMLVRLVQIVLGATSCVLLANAGRQWFSGRIGIVAGVFLALCPSAIYFDALIQKSVLDLFFLTLLLWLLGRIDRQRKQGSVELDREGEAPAEPIRLAATVAARREARPPQPSKSTLTEHPTIASERRPYRASRRRLTGLCIYAGIALGCLVLARGNAVIFVGVIALWLFIRFRAEPARTRARWVAAFCLGVGLILGPVVLRNRLVGGEWTLTASQFGLTFYIGNSEQANGLYVPVRWGHGSADFEQVDATELAEQATGRKLTTEEVSHYWTTKALAEIREDPAHWVRLMGRKWWLVWNVSEVGDAEDQYTYSDWSSLLRVLNRVFHFGILCPLAALGVCLTWKQRERLWLLYAMGLVYAASVAVFYVTSRYRFPLVPLLALFAAAGVTGLWAAVREKRWKAIGAGVGGAVVVAAVCNRAMVPESLMRATTHYNLAADLADKQGRPEEAIVQYAEAARLRPDFAAAHAALGDLLARTGRMEEGIGEMTRALQIRPDYPEAHNNLGNALAQSGRIQEAIGHYEQALRIEPVFVEAHNGLGNALAQSGRIQEAIGQYEQALRIAPDRADVHYNLGLALADVGRLAEAAGQFEQALRLKPDFAEAKASLARLRAVQ